MKYKRILYLQHAESIGGSAISLYLTLKELDRSRFEPIVGMIRPTMVMRKLYEDIGVHTVEMSDVTTYEHTTGAYWRYTNPIHWLGRWRQRSNIGRGAAATLKHVKSVQPDLVHLNSVVLLPSAVGLSRTDIPFLWHIREHPVAGLFRRRLSFIRNKLLRLDAELLFLSKADRVAWLNGGEKGTIFPNYVDLDVFSAVGGRTSARCQLGLSTEVPVVLFVGGFTPIKGIIIFLSAMRLVRKRFPSLRVIMPIPQPVKISKLPPDVRMARWLLPHLGLGTHYQRTAALMGAPDLAPCLQLLEPTTNIASLYVACDVLAFPHSRPHFARPVIEAAAAGRPSVASNLPGIQELILPGKTGLIVAPNDFESLANAICSLFDQPTLMEKMGKAAFDHAKKRFAVRPAVKKLQDIYSRILTSR